MIKQKGFTLVEVMVGMTIGLIVLAGVLNFFSSIIHANAEAVKQQQFEQTVHVMVNTIAADIRRAGYTPLGKTVPSLTIGGNNVGSFYTNDNCLLLTYRNPDSSIAYRGYLRDAATKAIYVLKNELTAPSSCSKSDPAWNATPVTDPSLLTVEAPSSPPSASSPGALANAVFQTDAAYSKLKWIHFILKSTSLKTQSGNAVTRDVEAAVTLRN